MFGEESKRNRKEMGSIELYGLSGTVRTIQCLTCLRHSQDGTIYCGCGKCLIPSEEHFDKIQSRIDIFADPLLVVKRGKAGERHGLEEWQYHHWKATDAARNCRKREYEAFAKRWTEDPSHQDNIHGWTLEYCMFPDYLKIIKIIYKATRGERDRYKNIFVLRWKTRRIRVTCPFTKIFQRCSESTCNDGLPTRTRNPPRSSTSKIPTKTTLSIIVNDMTESGTMGIIPTMARTTSMARTTRLARMAGMGQMSTYFLNCQNHFANFFASQSIFCWTLRVQTLANVVAPPLPPPPPTRTVQLTVAVMCGRAVLWVSHKTKSE